MASLDNKAYNEAGLSGDSEVDHKDHIEMVEHNKSQVSAQFIPASQTGGLSRIGAIRKHWKAVLFCVMCSFGATLDGFHQTIPGNIVANPGFIKQFGEYMNADGTTALDALHVSAWGGMLSGANIIGAIVGGFTADALGRKFNMGLMVFLLMIATTIEMVAKDWTVWLASKLFAGLGNGFAQTALVIYNSEIAPPQIRGFLLSTWAFFYAFGQLTASIGLQVLATSAHPGDYLRSIYSEWVFTGIFLIFLIFLPETPWYYARKEDHKRAKAALSRIAGHIPNYDVDKEYAVLQYEVAASLRLREEQKHTKWSEMFKGSNGRRFMITAAIPMYGQLVGGSLVFSYTTYFFQLAGLEDPFLASLIVFLLLIFFVAVSFYSTDLIGRRPLLLGAICVIFVSLLGIGIAGTVEPTTASKNSLIALACIWVVAYASGIAPIGSIYQAIGQMFGLIFNYTVPIMLSDQQAGWGVKTGYFFAGTAAVGGVIIYFIMPEFKGREYAEIDELFERKISARRFKQTKTAIQLAREAA